MEEGVSSNKYLAGFQNSYNQWLLCCLVLPILYLSFFLLVGVSYCGYPVIVFPMLDMGEVDNLLF